MSETKIEISSDSESPEPMKKMIVWLYENREILASLHNGWKPPSLAELVRIESAYNVWRNKNAMTSNGKGTKYHVTFKNRFGFAKWLLAFGPGPWHYK
jgi:hypothetical protein